MRSRMRNAARVLTISLASLTIVTAAAPFADSVNWNEKSVVWRINHEHYKRRLRSIGVSEALSNTARAHSYQMAISQNLRHSANLSSRVSGWRILGENVAVGYNLYEIHRAWMASPGHRANILEGRYRTVGVGIWRDAGGAYWVTTIFKG